jgi:hypothetical protein
LSDHLFDLGNDLYGVKFATSATTINRRGCWVFGLLRVCAFLPGDSATQTREAQFGLKHLFDFSL